MATSTWIANVSPHLTLLSVVVTAVATAILGWFTAVLAKETRRMADVTSRPHVVATIEPNAWAMNHADIRVDNTGTATAYDVEVSFDPPIPSEPDSRGEKPTPLERISVLKPGTGLVSYLTEFGPILETTYSVTVSWRRNPKSRKREVNCYALSMKDFEGMSYLGAGNPLTQIANEVKHIREDWRWVASGSRRLKVDTYSMSERLHEQRAAKRHFRKMRRQLGNTGTSTDQPTSTTDAPDQ